MSYAAAVEPAEPVLADSANAEPPEGRRPRAQGGVLLVSLAGALVTTCLTGASLFYAFTHIPEVDPNAEAAPVAEVAAIAAEAPDTPAKLDVLTPPVYGPELISEAPAAPFVRLSAQVTPDAVDMTALAQADGAQADGAQTNEVQPGSITRPCNDPCSAQAGYATPNDSQPAPTKVSDVSAHVNANADDDGNAPPPPDMVVN